MAKILACCALSLVLLAGWGHSQTQEDGSLLRGIPGQEAVEEELRVKYPKVFKRPVVVSFGAEWCRWCPAQKIHLRTLQTRGYRVIYFNIDDHKELFEFLGGKVEGDSVPLTVVVVKGKVKVSFNGLTYWRTIARAARECRDKRNVDIDIKIRV